MSKKPDPQRLQPQSFIDSQLSKNIKNRTLKSYRKRPIYRFILLFLIIGIVAWAVVSLVTLYHYRADIKTAGYENSGLSSQVNDLNSQIKDLNDKLTTKTDDYNKLKAAVISEAAGQKGSLLNTLTNNCQPTSLLPLPAPTIAPAKLPPAEQAILDKLTICFESSASTYIDNYIQSNQ